MEEDQRRVYTSLFAGLVRDSLLGKPKTTSTTTTSKGTATTFQTMVLSIGLLYFLIELLLSEDSGLMNKNRIIKHNMRCRKCGNRGDYYPLHYVYWGANTLERGCDQCGHHVSVPESALPAGTCAYEYIERQWAIDSCLSNYKPKRYL